MTLRLRTEKVVLAIIFSVGLLLLYAFTARAEEALPAPPKDFTITVTIQELNVLVTALETAPLTFRVMNPVREKVLGQYNAQLPKPAKTDDDKTPESKSTPGGPNSP
jgi:hypothetical protein